jgi:hypothetical protein
MMKEKAGPKPSFSFDSSTFERHGIVQPVRLGLPALPNGIGPRATRLNNLRPSQILGTF